MKGAALSEEGSLARVLALPLDAAHFTFALGSCGELAWRFALDAAISSPPRTPPSAISFFRKYLVSTNAPSRSDYPSACSLLLRAACLNIWPFARHSLPASRFLPFSTCGALRLRGTAVFSAAHALFCLYLRACLEAVTAGCLLVLGAAAAAPPRLYTGLLHLLTLTSPCHSLSLWILLPSITFWRRRAALLLPRRTGLLLVGVTETLSRCDRHGGHFTSSLTTIIPRSPPLYADLARALSASERSGGGVSHTGFFLLERLRC